MVLFWYLHFSCKCQCKLRRPLDTVDLEEPPDSCERTGAPVLWLSCEGPNRCLGTFYLSAILDRPVVMVAAPVDLSTKKAEDFSPQALQRLLVKD